MPTTFRSIIAMLGTLETSLTQANTSETLQLRQRVSMLKEALVQASINRAGDLGVLSPEISRMILGETLYYTQQEGLQTFDLGEDLDTHRMGLTTGRVVTAQINGVRTATREIVEISGLDLSNLTTQKINNDLLQDGIIAQHYQGQRETRLDFSSRRISIVARFFLTMSRITPKRMKQWIHQQILARNPMGYLNYITTSIIDSPFKTILNDGASPVAQAYLRWVQNPSRTQERALLRSMIRVLKAQRHELTMLRGLTTRSRMTQLQEAHLASVVTFLELVRELPGMEPMEAGEWQTSIRGIRSKKIMIPGLLAKPGNMGTWGALLDVLNHFDPITIHTDIFKQRRRRLFRTAAQAA